MQGHRFAWHLFLAPTHREAVPRSFASTAPASFNRPDRRTGDSARRVAELTTPLRNVHHEREAPERSHGGPRCWSKYDAEKECDWAIHSNSDVTRGCWMYTPKEIPETKLVESWNARAPSNEGCGSRKVNGKRPRTSPPSLLVESTQRGLPVKQKALAHSNSRRFWRAVHGLFESMSAGAVGARRGKRIPLPEKREPPNRGIRRAKQLSAFRGKESSNGSKWTPFLSIVLRLLGPRTDMRISPVTNLFT